MPACACSVGAAREISVVHKQYPAEPAQFKRLRLTYAEGIKLLQQNGYPDVSAPPRSLHAFAPLLPPWRSLATRSNSEGALHGRAKQPH